MTITAVAETINAQSAPVMNFDRRLEWGKAFAAMRRLIADKEDTAQVFEIMRALTGRSVAWGYGRLLREPQGGRMAFERVELADRLSDDVWLDSFADGTVGAAYRHFVRSENLSAQGLVLESRRTRPEIDAPHPMAWYSRRLRDIHDIWHVLTGYGRDALGEACVVSFSYPQTRSFGFGFIGWGAARAIQKENRSVPARRAVLEAYRNGRRARWLPGQDYEALFSEPLDAARARLNIARHVHYDAVPIGVRRALKLAA